MSAELLRLHHKCNVWCRGEVHCDTFYTSTDRIAKVVPWLEGKVGITIVAIEPQSEAKPLGPDTYVSLLGRPSNRGARYAMLIRWTFPKEAA